jgi:hypothetical protein
MEATYRAELMKGCPAAADDATYLPAVAKSHAAVVALLHDLPDSAIPASPSG